MYIKKIVETHVNQSIFTSELKLCQPRKPAVYLGYVRI